MKCDPVCWVLTNAYLNERCGVELPLPKLINYLPTAPCKCSRCSRRLQMSDSVETLGLPISLQLSRRRSAARGLERGPNCSAGGPQGRLAAPRKNVRMLSLLTSTKSSLQFNGHWHIFSKAQKKLPNSFFRGPARVTRAGGTGPLKAVAAP